MEKRHVRHVVFIVSEKPVDLKKLDLTDAECVIAEQLALKKTDGTTPWHTAKNVFKYFRGLTQEISASGRHPAECVANWILGVCNAVLFSPKWQLKPGAKPFRVLVADDDPSGSQKVSVYELQVIAMDKGEAQGVVKAFNRFLEIEKISAV